MFSEQNPNWISRKAGYIRWVGVAKLAKEWEMGFQILPFTLYSSCMLFMIEGNCSISAGNFFCWNKTYFPIKDSGTRCHSTNNAQTSGTKSLRISRICTERNTKEFIQTHLIPPRFTSSINEHLQPTERQHRFWRHQSPVTALHRPTTRSIKLSTTRNRTWDP